jgi:lipopolysaccharide export system protein LptA
MLLTIALAACCLPALAERADKDQPTIIEADRGVFDELKQVNVVSGRATLTRGTMRITGERMELRTAPDGYRSALVTAAPGELATFRQRRDPPRCGKNAGPGLAGSWAAGHARAGSIEKFTRLE